MNGDLAALVELINAGGVVAILVFLVVAFYRGDIISRNVQDRILEMYEKRMDQMTSQVLDRIDDLFERINGK